VYDRRGYSRSGGEVARSAAEHSCDAAAVLEALEARPSVLVGTSAGATIALDLAVRWPDLVRAMRECAELGIKHVWMHRGPGAGSVSDAATSYGRAHGITVIDGGCPLMFGPTGDAGHKFMRLVYARKVPKQV
jgi:CoA binding protein